MKWLLAAVALMIWGCTPWTAPAVGTQQAAPPPVADPEAFPTFPGAHLEVVGTINGLEAAAITVDGVVYGMSRYTEVRGSLLVGSLVKLEYVVNADGSRTVVSAKAGEFLDE